MLESPRYEHLRQFSAYTAPALYFSQVCISGKLLRYGGRSADSCGSSGDLCQYGAEHPAPVKAVMLVECFIFYCNESILEVIRHFTHRNYSPVFGVVQGIYLSAVYVIENRRALDVGIQTFLIDASYPDGSYDCCQKDHRNTQYEQSADHRQQLSPSRCICKFLHLVTRGFSFFGFHTDLHL